MKKKTKLRWSKDPAAIRRRNTTITIAIMSLSFLSGIGASCLNNTVQAKLDDLLVESPSYVYVAPEISIEPIKTVTIKEDPLFEEDVQLLSKILYTEINYAYCNKTKKNRLSTDDEMKWVAATIVNRLNSKLFPDTMKGVVYQGNGRQFNGILSKEWGMTTERTDRIAREVLSGKFEIDPKILWYHNPYISNQTYVKSMEKFVVHEAGGHVFCNNDGRWVAVASK